MKKLFPVAFLFPFFTLRAQKQNNVFISAELNNSVHGLSAVYNRQLTRSNFGVGAGLELIDFGQQKLGGIMPSLDLRYYLRTRKSTFVPIAQAGYNFYNFRYAHLATGDVSESKGRMSYSLGLGYSYTVTRKGGGPFAAIRYRNLEYKVVSSTLNQRYNIDGLRISFGWRF